MGDTTFFGGKRISFGAKERQIRRDETTECTEGIICHTTEKFTFYKHNWWKNLERKKKKEKTKGY